MTKPFLKWAGGKSRVAPHILPELGTTTRLVEPFAGSCALFLASGYTTGVLNDINPDLIRLYKTLQEHGQAFIDYVHQTYFDGTHNTKDQYLALRARFNSLQGLNVEDTSPTAWDRSALFVYLNRHGFNGMCRYNATGGFNIPYGQYKAPGFPGKEMLAFHHATKDVTFVCQSFTDLMEAECANPVPGTVLYCDPPYIELSKSASFVGYATEGFPVALQETLAQLAWQCAGKGIRVLISNHDVAPARALYEHGKTFDGTAPLTGSGPATRITAYLVHRSISANAASRGGAPELLAIYDAR